MLKLNVLGAYKFEICNDFFRLKALISLEIFTQDFKYLLPPIFFLKIQYKNIKKFNNSKLFSLILGIFIENGHFLFFFLKILRGSVLH